MFNNKILLLILSFITVINCININENNKIIIDNINSGSNQNNSFLYLFGTQPYQSDSFIFLLDNCLATFYNKFIYLQFVENGNQSIVSIELFEDIGCQGPPVFKKKMVGLPPFKNVHIPFAPAGFNSTDLSFYDVDIKQPSPVPLGSVILELYLNTPTDRTCDLSIFGYDIYFNGTQISADGQTSTLYCQNNVPYTHTCTGSVCDQVFYLNTCLHYNTLSSNGFCSSNVNFPFK